MVSSEEPPCWSAAPVQAGSILFAKVERHFIGRQAMYGLNGILGFLFFVTVLWGLGTVVRRLPNKRIMWLVKLPVVVVMLLLAGVMLINIVYSLLRH
jgi:hypothetical protein